VLFDARSLCSRGNLAAVSHPVACAIDLKEMKNIGAVAWKVFLTVLLVVSVVVLAISSLALIGLFEIGKPLAEDPNIHRGLTRGELASIVITAVIGMMMSILLRKIKWNSFDK